MIKKEILSDISNLSAETLSRYIIEGNITFQELKQTGLLNPLKLKEIIELIDPKKHKRLKEKSKLEIFIDVEFQSFKHENAFFIISSIEDILGKKNIKLNEIREGSTIVLIELDYDDALKLMSIIKEGEFKELGITKARVKHFSDKETKLGNEDYLKDFSKIISEIKLLSATDFAKALLILKERVSELSNKFNQLILINSRYNRWQRMTLQLGLYKISDAERFHSEIVYSFLSLLDSIDPEDLNGLQGNKNLPTTLKAESRA